MAVITHLAGICFFAALAASGYIATTQVLYWTLLIPIFILGLINYSEAERNIKRVENGKGLTVSLTKMMPLIIDVDLDSRIVHLIFANLIHAAIAFTLLSAPVLATSIILVTVINLVSIHKFKGIIKSVKNDISG